MLFSNFKIEHLTLYKNVDIHSAIAIVTSVYAPSLLLVGKGKMGKYYPSSNKNCLKESKRSRKHLRGTNKRLCRSNHLLFQTIYLMKG